MLSLRQGLFENGPAIKSTYSFEECSDILFTSYGSKCIEYESQIADVVPIVPPYSYNYDCASVVLTIYTPVYIYGYCMQLLFQPLFHGVLRNYVSYASLPPWLRSRLPGVLWPLVWPAAASFGQTDQTSESIDNAKDATEPDTLVIPIKRDTELINTERIVTSMMYHLSIFVTFGLCNPYLAVSIVLTVITSCYEWVFLIGRFIITRTNKLEGSKSFDASVLDVTGRAHDLNAISMALNSTAPSVDITCTEHSSVSAAAPDANGNGGDAEPESANGSLGDPFLKRLDIVLSEAERSLARCVWPLIWTSCAFFALLCLDMAGGI
jgi:hypothetical protein